MKTYQTPRNIAEIEKEIANRAAGRRQSLSKTNDKDLKLATNPKLINAAIEELCDRVALDGPRANSYIYLQRSISSFFSNRSRRSWVYRLNFIGKIICEELEAVGLKAEFYVNKFSENFFGIDRVSLLVTIGLPDRIDPRSNSFPIKQLPYQTDSFPIKQLLGQTDSKRASD